MGKGTLCEVNLWFGENSLRPWCVVNALTAEQSNKPYSGDAKTAPESETLRSPPGGPNRGPPGQKHGPAPRY